MKPFDLERALAGEPVLLRNGTKAIVCFMLPDKYLYKNGKPSTLPLKGIILDHDGYVESAIVNWAKNGSYYLGETSEKDIIGMWEEKELTQEEILEKAYNENLRITFPKALLTNGYEVIAKTKHNSYIIRNGSYIVDSCNLDDVTFSIYQEKQKETETFTVTLPKPFKPKKGDTFFYLTSDGKEDSSDGNCFRTREDAQAWLDAMKNALDN